MRSMSRICSIGRLPRWSGRVRGGADASGFTLVELVITVGTTLIAVLGSIQLFTYCTWQSENAGNLAAATLEAQAKVEEIRSTPFSNIMTTFGPQAGGELRTFTPSRVQGLGVIYITEVNANLVQVEVAINWLERGQFVVGEDRNLNGVLDGDEDGDGNGRIGSPASLVTLIARR